MKMEQKRFMERRPFVFSILMVLLLFFINGAGVAAAQINGLPAATFAIYTQLAMVAVLVILVSGLRLWGEIGMRAAGSAQSLMIYAPGLLPVIGNLSFGFQASPFPIVMGFLLLALTSGFNEELIFRGLILRAFLPRGPLAAVLISAAFFGFAHLPNAFSVSSLPYVLVQVVYSLAFGFAFGAMVVRGRNLWPVMIAHALANFFAFMNSGRVGADEVTLQVMVVAVIYILTFTIYGWYLMRQQPQPALT
jgi:uncharacterized protein